MKDYGVDVSSGTIFGRLKKIHFLYIKPLYKAIGKILRKANHYHADESGWKLFGITNKKGNYKWFIWVFISKDIVLFVLHQTRSSKVAYKVLFDIEIDDIKNIDKKLLNIKIKEMLNVDKFSSYKSLKKAGLVELAFCWSHQRREFIDLATKYPELKSFANKWIKRIGVLYHINNERKKYNQNDTNFKKYDKELRTKIEEIYSLINIEYDHSVKNAIMDSLKEHWEGLILFVEHPEIPMDNNQAERMLRHMVLGRKNYWGNHSFWAGELTVAMFSIIQTCLLHKISPRAYLTYYFTECAKRGSAPSSNEIEQFLPCKLPDDVKRKLIMIPCLNLLKQK